jgi:signal transduction histidine kinase
MAEITAALGMDLHVVDRFHSWLVVPLVVKEVQIGFLVLIHRKPNYYSRSAREMAQMFANHVAIAIQNAQLYHRAQASAVLEERNRLARELHDSVAQALYSISLYANASRKALLAEKMDAVDKHLAELQRLSSEAVADMRLLIFELRPPVLEEEGLVEAIRTRLESVETRSGIKVDFYVDGELRLNKAFETELYRVTMEALNNILKHAQATQIVVNITSDERGFNLSIRDDGKGFDASIFEKGGGVGFRNMQERIQKIGGVVRVDTAPGRGTSILVKVEDK